ncbi:MAG: DUF386 family protein [Acidobacteria bacterium]|nr:DUF386 family protein [Acidobacteriota bacterium]
MHSLNFSDLAAGKTAIIGDEVFALRIDGPTRPCEETGDDILLAGPGRSISLKPGEFMILFPSDGHMPGVSDGIHATSQKVVIKVLLFP